MGVLKAGGELGEGTELPTSFQKESKRRKLTFIS